MAILSQVPSTVYSSRLMVLCTNSNYIHEPGRLVEVCGKDITRLALYDRTQSNEPTRRRGGRS